MKKLTKREDVYKAIDSERDYQDIRWKGTKSSKNISESNDSLDRTLDEFILYIQGYSSKLVDIASTTDDARDKLDFVRKVGGLCVACMEIHGAPLREINS